jgi:hypothetical protein
MQLGEFVHVRGELLMQLGHFLRATVRSASDNIQPPMRLVASGCSILGLGSAAIAPETLQTEKAASDIWLARIVKPRIT